MNTTNKKQTQTYLFGYGSLICSHSRSVTCPELKDRPSIPVVIQGIERTWSKRSIRGMTAMGVRFRSKARCAGILVPLESSEELAMFDERELGYQRKQVSLDQVQKVPFLGRKHANEEHDDFFEFLNDCVNDDDAEDRSLAESSVSSDDESQEEEDDENDVSYDNIEVWVYVPNQTLAPTADHPIAQSYVDTILRGCMAVGGEAFCAEFLKTTAGWHPEEWSSAAYNDKDCVDQVWINDRQAPVYLRGDPKHSRQHAPVFDSLIAKYRSDSLSLRVESEQDEETTTTQPSTSSKHQLLQKHKQADHSAIRRTHTTKASLRNGERQTYKKKLGSSTQ